MNIVDKDIRIDRIRHIEKCKKDNSDIGIYIWGCALTAKTIKGYIEEISEIRIDAFILDDNYYNIDTYEGIPVIKASEWFETVSLGSFVICGFTNEKRAEKLIMSLPEGIEGVYMYYPYSMNMQNAFLTYEYYMCHKSEFEEIYSLMADDMSKKTMETFINGCVSGDCSELNKLRIDGQYFNELTKGWGSKYFVDCGAYIGDTIESVVDFYTDTITKIVSFEPDEDNCTLLNNKVREKGIDTDKIELIKKGTWSRRDKLFFSSSDSSSSITNDGDISIQVDSIDNVIDALGIEPDYIKLDVEGSELESLIGAEKCIKKNKPLIAVCVYHKPEDIFELTNKIREYDSERAYSYYMRYHGPDLRELVLYAIAQ